MKRLNNTFNISELLVKKMVGELNEREHDEFEQWLNHSIDNRNLYNRLNNSKGQAGWKSLSDEIDVDEAWLNYSRKIKKSKKRIVLNFLRYAAAILLPAALLVFVFQHNPKKDIQTQASDLEQIVPGTKNATLVLDDGKSIDLESAQKLELEEKDGTRILKKDDQLTYQEAEEQRENFGEVLNNTLQVPRGGEYNLVLADGTKVYMNSMSKLVFPVKFIGNSREVSLEGEACFMVQKDKFHPFIVNVNGLRIEVLGTTFNVNAYSNDHDIITTLVEGKVKMSDNSDPENEIILNPDEQVVFNNQDKQLKTTKVNAKKYIQWINGVYVFDNQSLGDIAKTLSRWYDFNYQFEQDEIKNITFNGGLNKYDDIEPILDIIESTGKVGINVEGKNIRFMKK